MIVGVSGGPDSMCLLDVLHILAKKYDFTVHVAHVNYNLRGKDSKLDETLVQKQAKVYGFPFHILQPKKKSVGNLEESLRDIRYTFFEKLRQKENARCIVVAHNQDDQAETFLMRLLRGSGGSGLSSMQMKNGYIVRPLLKCSREEILQYAKERHISFRIDKSNSDTNLLRNRIRHHLLPLLEKEYQPQIKSTLADTAELLSADRELLEGLASASFQMKKGNGRVSFSCKELFADSEVLASYKLRLILRPLLASKNPSKGFIEEIVKALKSLKSKHQTMTSRGLKLVRKGDTVTLLKLAN